MLKAIKEIGEYAINKKYIDDMSIIFMQDPASTPDYKHVLAIIINKTDKEFEFGGIQLEQYSKDKIEKYLYRKGSGARGHDMSPTSRIVEIKKTYFKNIHGWFKSIIDKPLELDTEDINFLTAIYNCLIKNEDAVLSELDDKIKLFDGKEKGIITLLIDDGIKKYIGEFPIFKKILTTNAVNDYFKKYNTESIENNIICSVCRKESTVFGFFTTFKCYTVDKIGFVSGGFDRKSAWKNFPVCQKCAIALEAGKKYLKEYMNYNFYGTNYLIIPKIMMRRMDDSIYEIFDIFENFKREINGNIKISKEHEKLFTYDEEDILEILGQQKNFLNYNFLFYDEGKNRNEFKIILYIEDIYPSRLKRLFEAKKYVDNIDIFTNILGEERSFSFNFSHIWRFFNDDKSFLEIVNNIFVGQKIDNSLLIQKVMKKIRDDFVNLGMTKISTLAGLQLIEYLGYLEILDKDNGGTKMVEEDKDITGTRLEKIDKLFREFPDFFNSHAKKAVFLEGALGQLLLDIQYQERGATPFRSKFRGLKLNEQTVRSLLPEMQNKFEEYDKNYYRGLETIISEYMIRAGDKWNMSNDDISFYFVVGMDLKKLFKHQEE